MRVGGTALKVAGAALAGLIATATLAQTPPPAAKPGLAIDNFPAKSGKKLVVSSMAFTEDGDIPFENTRYRGNVFPGLAWSKGPYGTISYAVVMQDADVNYRGGPLLHWTMYDIPGVVLKLDPGMTEPPGGASYGPNVRGAAQPYMGPHTPPGPKHHYHFAIFALDETIPADPTLSWDAMAAAMTGHVLASGEVIGLGQADPAAAPPTAAPAPAAPAPH